MRVPLETDRSRRALTTVCCFPSAGLHCERRPAQPCARPWESRKHARIARYDFVLPPAAANEHGFIRFTVPEATLDYRLNISDPIYHPNDPQLHIDYCSAKLSISVFVSSTLSHSSSDECSELTTAIKKNGFLRTLVFYPSCIFVTYYWHPLGAGVRRALRRGSIRRVHRVASKQYHQVKLSNTIFKILVYMIL